MLLSPEEMERIRKLARETRDSMDGMNSKIRSSGHRYHALMNASHQKAMELGYGGSLAEWISFVKRLRG